VPWQLHKHFDINRNHELFAEEELKATFRDGMNGSPALGGWKTFCDTQIPRD
jgi:hypothetical protein